MTAVTDEPGFDVGDPVIYPQHGAGRIVERETITFDGEDIDYFVIDLSLQDLRVRVPASGVADVGVRPPIPEDELEDLFELLRDHDARVAQNFSRRFKNNQRRLNEGDVWQLAEVVRNLAVRKYRRHLSPSESAMYLHARNMLVAEIALTLDVSIEEAEVRLDQALPSDDDVVRPADDVDLEDDLTVE
jgi:CarD family transcriptional regulator